MQRPFALTHYPQPHPFRRFAREVARENRKARDDNDWKLFLLSFSAFFVCFTTFIF